MLPEVPDADKIPNYSGREPANRRMPFPRYHDLYDCKEEPCGQQVQPHICCFSKPYPITKLITTAASRRRLLSEASQGE